MASMRHPKCGCPVESMRHLKSRGSYGVNALPKLGDPYVGRTPRFKILPHVATIANFQTAVCVAQCKDATIANFQTAGCVAWCKDAIMANFLTAVCSV